MELDISEKTYILPSAMIGNSEVLQLADNGNGDCIEANERELKTGKGKFLQYELCLKNKDGELRFAQFLLSQHIKPLVSNLGKQTKDWINTSVQVSGVPEEKGDKTYYSLKLESVGVPEWAVEKVV